MSKYSEYWDNTVRPFAEELIKIATTDKSGLEYYGGAMIWAVEHDIADGRELGLNSLNLLLQVRDTLADEEYYDHIHKETPIDEINKMKELSELIDNLINIGK